MSELLVAEGIVAGYGDSVILEDVSIALEQSGSLALLGRNGVGKTTLLLTLLGLTHLKRGRLIWLGRDITHQPTWRRARLGMGWVPQERFMYPSLTVDEHLSVVARPGSWHADRIYRHFPGLKERRRNYGNQLSGGEQQMLALARALMTNPKLLLLDEPMEGLAPLIVRDIMDVIRGLVQAGEFAVIMVDQHVRLALSLTQEAVILERGRIAHCAPSTQVLSDDATLTRLLAVG